MSVNGNIFNFVPQSLFDGSTRLLCDSITDRNGNRQQITYDNYAHPLTVTDTNGRVVNFVYDDNHNLTRITQNRNGVTFIWAEFSYAMKTLNPNFAAGLQTNLPTDPNITVLDRVQLPDGATYRFTYNNYGQMIQFAHHAPDGTQRAYTWYDAAHRWIADQELVFSDCPRITVRRDWAKDWNSERPVTTKYSSDPASESGGQPAWSQVETPDGTRYKELYFDSGWRQGLTQSTEAYAWNGSFHVKKKWTTTAWEQDSTDPNYAVNPRPTIIHIYDDPDSDSVPDKHRWTTIGYTSYSRPNVVTEYTDGPVALRRVETTYLDDPSGFYTAFRLLGLVKQNKVYDQDNVLVAKQTFEYDLPNTEYTQQLPTTPTGHNGQTSYYGRGNLHRVWQWDVSDLNADTNYGTKRLVAEYGYNITGAPVFARDASGHTTRWDYTDRYSNSVNYNTYAYPTRITDPLQNTLPGSEQQHLETTYQYATGLVTRTSGLKPQGAATGLIQTVTYDAVDRVDRVDNLTTGDYTRYEYFPNENRVAAYRRVEADQPEFKTEQITDGAGRVRAVRAPHLGGAANRLWGNTRAMIIWGAWCKVLTPLKWMAIGRRWAMMLPMGGSGRCSIMIGRAARRLRSTLTAHSASPNMTVAGAPVGKP